MRVQTNFEIQFPEYIFHTKCQVFLLPAPKIHDLTDHHLIT